MRAAPLLIRKTDIILIIFFGFAALTFSFALNRVESSLSGQTAVIAANGKVTEVSLSSDTTVEIKDSNGHIINIVRVENGAAVMEYAECPDQVCVRQGSISSPAEIITCLPNRVVVTVTGKNTSEVDGVAK
ncbi:lipoprotein [Clostridia bacterium]|nr:lipoprotein [Clostridia bacterium]